MSNLIKRTVPVILVLVLCITCLVSPVSAATESTMYELLDYATLNDTGSNYVDFVGSKSVVYSVPNRAVIRYVDMLISMVGAVSSVSVGPNTSNLTQLTVDHIDRNLYRVYGPVPSKTYTSFTISFDSGSTSTSWYTIQSIKLSTSEVSYVPSIGTINVWDQLGGNTTITMSSPSDEPEVHFTKGSGTVVSDFIVTVYLSEWKKFDYIDVLLYVDAEQVSSIVALQDDSFLDFDVSYIVPDNDIIAYYWVMVRVDLSSCNLSSSTSPKLILTGSYDNGVSSPNGLATSKVLLKSISGLVAIPDPSPTLSFWYNLRDFLSDLFGENDSSSETAIDTQNEINLTINNQIIGAVEDWNTHIEVVETGYNQAFQKTTPALSWLASLADSIFTNMGWFGNIYFFIGLISVFMLILSKSGLAHKIGSTIRKGD